MSTSLLFILPLFHAIPTNCFSSTQPLCHDNESSALLQFKESFDRNVNACNGPFDYPKTASWKLEGVNKDCCSWDGVECDEDTGHVIGLNLSSSCLYGSMASNSSLFRLVHLQRLNLAYNDFNFSQVPNGFGNLSKLTYLNLSNSFFWGQVPPNFSELSKLSSLDLSHNFMLYLISLKSLVQNLTSLEDLRLSNVQISSPMLEILSNLSGLTTLHLISCRLHGEFPVGIFKLQKLKDLKASNNQDLTGYLPEFYSSTPLKSLSLTGTSFFGKLPASIGNLDSLNELHIGSCNFSGLIPPSLGNLTQLTTLNLFNNSFIGVIPSSFSNLLFLNYLDLSGNQLSGSIPSSFGNLTQLSFLDFSYNSFMGHIPPSLSNLISMGYLDFSHCQFSGSIPSSFGKLVSLYYLDFSYCQLSGLIPSSIGNLTQLVVLDFSDNSFMDQIPSSLSNLISLSYLAFSNNQFSGSIPSAFGNLTRLTVLKLSYCFIRSLKPSSLSMSWLENLSKLHIFSFKGINLEAKIPSSLANLTQLSILSMASDELTGQIPSWLGNLTQLTMLILPYNKLQGSIPLSIFKLEKLETLYLCSNNLSGIVTLDMFHRLKYLTALSLSQNNKSFLSKTNSNATLNNVEVLELGSCNLRHFPDILHNQTRLLWLDLSDNNIQGQIPKWVMNISEETTVVNFSYNLLTGFDQSMVNFTWPQLQILDLRSNKLQALPPIPPPSTLVYLVADNMIQGEISPLICNLSSLYSFDLSNNKLRGILPTCLSNFSSSLTILNLRGNNFHGSIPQLCVKGSRMKMIDLSQNQFKGVLPRSLSNCRKLEILNLGSNNLNDVFPTWLGPLPKLRVLILRHNGLYGVVGSPTTIFASPKLRILDISSNRFTGKLPFEYFRNWKFVNKVDVNDCRYMLASTSFNPSGYGVDDFYPYSMTITNKGKETVYPKIIEVFAAIDLSSNNFNGMIPEFIGNLNGFQLLNLSYNNLTGRIPLSLGNLTTLESLDLSQNKLSEQIPWQLTQLTFLESFNVSHNQLTGPIPHGNQFDTFDNSSFDGNSGLCGYPLSKNCENPKPSPLPISSIEVYQESWFHIQFDWIIILMGYGSGLVIGVVIGNIVTEKK